MRASSWVGVVTLVTACSLSGMASAQNGGRESEGNPPPTYTPPPTTYTPPPAYGGPVYPAPPPPAGPKTLPYDEGDPVPAGYRVVSKPRTGLLIGGGITFGVFYGLTVMAASGSSDNDAKLNYIPVIGPVLYGNTLTHDFAVISRFFLWIDALAQAAGATMLAVGSIPKTQLVRNDWAARVHIAPMVTAQATGLSFSGAF